MHHAVQPVDLIEGQPEDLALPQPQVAARIRHRLVPARQLAADGVDLPGGPRHDLRPHDPRRADLRRLDRVPGNERIRDGLFQDARQVGKKLLSVRRADRQIGRPRLDDARGPGEHVKPAVTQGRPDVPLYPQLDVMSGRRVAGQRVQPQASTGAERHPACVRIQAAAGELAVLDLGEEPIGIDFLIE